LTANIEITFMLKKLWKGQRRVVKVKDL